MTPNLLYSNDVAAEYPDSWYASTVVRPPRHSVLQNRVRCDVCIIGAGFTGLSAALALAEAGVDVVLLDAHRVGWGASGRNGGQLGTGQRVAQDDLESRHGLTAARALWDLAQRSKSLVLELIDRYGIECDYQPGIVYADHKYRYSNGTQAYVDKLNRQYGYEQISFASREQTAEMLGTDAYYSSSIDTGAGHLHPLKYALGLARAAVAAGVRIFEGSEVLQIGEQDTVTVGTANGMVTASSLVVACNGYLGDLNREVASRVMPINNYIIATEPLAEAVYDSLIKNNMAVADSRLLLTITEKRRIIDFYLEVGKATVTGFPRI